MVSRKEAITVKLNQVTEDVLKVIDSYGFKQEGAYNLRLNGMAVCHGDSRHIAIVKKQKRQNPLRKQTVRSSRKRQRLRQQRLRIRPSRLLTRLSKRRRRQSNNTAQSAVI